MEEFFHPKEPSQTPSTIIVIEGLTIGELINDLAPNMLRYIERFGLQDSSQDILQDVYLALIAESKKTHIRDPKAYLFGVLRNTIKGYCEARKKRNNIYECLQQAQLECQKSFVSDPFLMQELKKEKQRKITHLLNLIEIHLKPEQRKVIYAKYFEEKSYETIAMEMRKNEDAVRQIASRSERKLKSLI